MGVTKFMVLILSLICATAAVPLVRERRQNVIYGTTYTAPSYYGMQDTACFQRRRMSEPSWTKPVCNPDGSFRDFQCEAYSRFKCWCVYSNGMMIPGSAVDFKDDPIREGPKMNCAAKRAIAPKPAPNPPPLKTPFQDPSIGWQLGYRDAAIKNNPFIPIYGDPGSYLGNSYSDTVTVPESPSPYTGCPDPCAPPCSCVSGTYRGVLPHTNKNLPPVKPLPVNPLPVKALPVKPLPVKSLPVKPLPVKPLPVKPLPVADKKQQEKREEEPVEENDSENKPPREEDEEEEREEDESEPEKKEDDNDKETAENEESDQEENEEKDDDEDENENAQEAEPTEKEDEPKKDDKPVTKTDIKSTKKKGVKETKAAFKTKTNDENTTKKAQEAKKNDKPAKKAEKNIDGIDEEDEEDD